jgi:hypothetical protein
MKKDQAIDVNIDWDFGFSAVNETELKSVETLCQKADALYAAILPLLTKLKENADKDYIFWPNRLPKVEEFEEKLKKIYEK